MLTRAERCARLGAWMIEELQRRFRQKASHMPPESPSAFFVCDPGGGDFELAAAGTYPARCYRVVDVGTQYSQAWDKHTHQLMVSWELVGTQMDDGRPFTMHQTYTASLHKKAKLRQHLEAWRGREFTDDELKGFDLFKILGHPCLIGVVHNERDGTMYANVSAVMTPTQGQAVGPLVNEKLAFNLNAPDEAVFAKLSERMQDRIKGSAEWKAREEAARNASGAQAPGDGPGPASAGTREDEDSFGF